MVRNKFHQFIHFGPIADTPTRSRLALSIWEALSLGTDAALPNIENFGKAIENILKNKTLREFCAKSPELPEIAALEILDFIREVKRDILAAESPFNTESQILEEFKQILPPQFEEAWEGLGPFLTETYPHNELNIPFYTQTFRASFGTRKKKLPFESVKAHFTDQWQTLLDQKENSREEEYIEERRKGFSEALARRLEAMQGMEKILPGPSARLWNLAKTAVQNPGFDVFNRYAELLRRDPLLQALADLLGRGSPGEAETLETPLSRAELAGIRETGELREVLPSEFALLPDKTTELLFYKKLAEKKLQARAYRHTESRRISRFPRPRKGPFILCIDTSGSMRGPPETLAKTFCFALLKIALKEARSCYLISFGLEIETLDITNLETALEDLIGFLSHSFYGGTDPRPAFEAALTLLETESFSSADVIMISDFLMPGLDEPTRRRIQEAQKNKTEFHSLLIGDSRDPAVNTQALQDFDAHWVYDVDYRLF